MNDSQERTRGRARLARAAVLTPLLLASACASIVSDNESTTYIGTEPEVARCELHGQDFERVVNTPASVTLPSKAAPVTVACEAEGYRRTVADMDTSADGWIFGNILFGGLIGVAIDAARGAGQKFPPNITIVLEPESFDSVAARDAWFDARREKIRTQWDDAIAKVKNECSRNMRDLCNKKIQEAETLREAQLEDLEQRREAAVIAANDPQG